MYKNKFIILFKNSFKKMLSIMRNLMENCFYFFFVIVPNADITVGLLDDACWTIL